MKCQSPKKILLVIVGIIITLVVIFLPFIVEKAYNTKPPSDFFYMNYDTRDILAYYGSVLSFAGTVILGALTLHQNKKAQDKSDEVNRLQLELQRKSMAMAEAQYSKSQHSNGPAPKFEVGLYLTHGDYQGLSLSIKNVTSTVISCLTPLSVNAVNSDNQTIGTAKKMAVKYKSLSSMQSTELTTDFPSLKGSKNFTLSFSFSCEDEKGNTHYYRATAFILASNSFYKEPWAVEKVG